MNQSASFDRHNRHSVFAVTAPGLEPICAREAGALGLRARARAGGIAWSGSLESIARANLWLRTASRVIVRVARFRATAFHELERQARRVPWPLFVTSGMRVSFRVTCRKSKLYHSDAVAQRLAEAVAWAVPGVAAENVPSRDDESDDGGDRLQRFVVRLAHDVCTVSADSSGALLHRRGYRQQVARAPLRETLAAAMLLGAGWQGDVPLDDPLCGSGTIPIEAALIARRLAPGLERSFAFQHWPDLNPALWPALVADARDRALARAPVAIHGADRDAGAITAARANAERAGVAADVDFDVQPVSAMTPMPPPGLLVSNPPYGVRVGDADRLRNLYAQLGHVARRSRAGWSLALLGASPRLEGQLGLELQERFRTRNGGIPVRLVTAVLPSE